MFPQRKCYFFFTAEAHWKWRLILRIEMRGYWDVGLECISLYNGEDGREREMGNYDDICHRIAVLIIHVMRGSSGITAVLWLRY